MKKTGLDAAPDEGSEIWNGASADLQNVVCAGDKDQTVLKCTAVSFGGHGDPLKKHSEAGCSGGTLEPTGRPAQDGVRTSGDVFVNDSGIETENKWYRGA